MRKEWTTDRRMPWKKVVEMLSTAKYDSGVLYFSGFTAIEVNLMRHALLTLAQKELLKDFFENYVKDEIKNDSN